MHNYFNNLVAPAALALLLAGVLIKGVDSSNYGEISPCQRQVYPPLEGRHPSNR